MATQKKPARRSGGVAKRPTVKSSKSASAKKVAKKVSSRVTAKSTSKSGNKKIVDKKAAKTKKIIKTPAKVKKVAVAKKPVKKVKKSAPVAAKKAKTVKKAISKSSVKTSKSPALIVKKTNPKDKLKKTHTAPAKKEEVKKTVSAKKTHETPSPASTIKARRSGERTKMVVYQPEFVKSVLDQPEQNNGPVFRYSDPELQEFKEIILKKMDAAKKELVYLQGLITRKDETGTDDTENKYMSMEDGSGTMEREQLNQMASRQIQFIDHLEKALMRIENKTYGICRVTGKLIEKARLRAVPHATLSMEAKQSMNK
jgi:RNA polymerase-binding transcription factor DksA